MATDEVAEVVVPIYIYSSGNIDNFIPSCSCCACVVGCPIFPDVIPIL